MGNDGTFNLMFKNIFNGAISGLLPLTLIYPIKYIRVRLNNDLKY